MADSLKFGGHLLFLLDENGDAVDGGFQIQVNGEKGVWTVFSQSKAAPALLEITVPIGVTGTGTDNHVMRWDGATAAQDSLVQITDFGGVLTPTEYITGTDTTPLAGTDTFAIISQGAGVPYLRVSGTGAYSTIDIGVWSFTQGANDGALMPTTLTADRAWTLPDLTGTVLLDTTPYSDFPPFSDRFRLFGSNDTDGTPGEVDLDVTLTMTGSTLKVADNSIGPTQIDQAAAYTWSGDSEFSGNNLFSNSNTFQGNDDHSGVPSFTNAAGPKFSGITKHVVPLPTASNQVLTSGTGTPTVTLTAANATTSGRVNVSVVFAGAGTLRVYIPLGQVPYQFLGRLITIQDVIHTMTKTSGGNATSKVDNVGVAGFAGTANSNTITASDVALDATDRHTTAAPTAVTTTNATITPAQLGGALALYFCFDIVSTTNQTVAVSVNLGAADHTEVHITEAN